MTRLLIQVHGEPDRVAIVEDSQAAGKLFTAWCRLRYFRGEAMGGAIHERVVRCRCGQWVPWLIGHCEPACDWRQSADARATFEADAERTGLMQTQPDMLAYTGKE